jgi:1,4-dihydroxy-2-naphthoate octaprenyltransferase
VSLATAWAWVRASRPPSQSYIGPPLLLGQLLALPRTGALDWSVLLWVQLFGLFDQLFIVYGNDYADRETDRLNATATLFSGGSRVLSDGSLQPRALLRASVLAGVATVICSAVLALAHGRPWSLPLGLLALVLLWSYSYRPLQLNYRGGGELVQTLGVALCLPLFGYYNQAGTLAGFPFELMQVLVPTHLACAMATSLPDEPSDRGSGKRSASVWLGPARNRWLIVVLDAASVLALWHQTRHAGVTVAPALCALALAIGPLGAPGTRLLSVRVALAVGCTLSIVLGLIALSLP